MVQKEGSQSNNSFLIVEVRAETSLSEGFTLLKGEINIVKHLKWRDP